MSGRTSVALPDDGSTHHITEGDQRPYLDATLKLDGRPYNLDQTDLDVKRITFEMRDGNGETVVQSRSNVEVVEANAGRLQYRFRDRDTATPGTYRAMFVVEYMDRTALTFPNRGDLHIRVTER